MISPVFEKLATEALKPENASKSAEQAEFYTVDVDEQEVSVLL
jgi:hypothetical protein